MEDSELYRTSDRGKTWSPDDVAFEAVTAVDFRNDVGMVLERNYEAGNSTLWKTTDGGETWNEAGELEPELVTELLLLDAQTAIAVGVDGGYRTTDGGTNWEELSLRQDADEVDFNDPLSGVEFNGEGRGVMWEGDEFGELYVSSDRGATWELVREFEDPVDDVAFTDSQTAVAVGASVWQTTDGERCTSPETPESPRTDRHSPGRPPLDHSADRLRNASNDRDQMSTEPYERCSTRFQSM